MAVPVITAVTSPVAAGNQAWVIGTNFGQVSAVALEDTTTHEVFECDNFIVDSGMSLHLTAPRNIPLGLYEVVLSTLLGEMSINNAGTVEVIETPLPLPPEPIFPEPGTTSTAVRERLRYELGDYVESFSAVVLGDGQTRRYELPGEVINTTGLAVTITNDDNSSPQQLTPADYTLEGKQGVITLNTALGANKKLYVQGTHGQFFTDVELDMFITSALLKHTHNATVRTIVRNPVNGFVTYSTDAVTLANLPAVEVHPVALLATIEALWTIAADASYDIDVTTAEGTTLPRQERYRAIMEMITAQQERYNQLCQQLNVGMNRLEMFTLRRVSQTTGRLVPIFEPREYDEWGPLTRVYPPVDRGVTGTGSTHRMPLYQQYPPGP